jgi:hypothetical protein
MCELKKATHYPMKLKAMVNFLQNLTIAFCLIAAAVVVGCV